MLAHRTRAVIIWWRYHRPSIIYLTIQSSNKFAIHVIKSKQCIIETSFLLTVAVKLNDFVCLFVQSWLRNWPELQTWNLACMWNMLFLGTRQKGNSMSNHPMISPTISDLSETLHTASPLLDYCILKVTAHSIGYFSISNFQKFLWFLGRLNIVEHDAIKDWSGSIY